MTVISVDMNTPELSNFMMKQIEEEISIMSSSDIEAYEEFADSFIKVHEYYSTFEDHGAFLRRLDQKQSFAKR